MVDMWMLSVAAALIGAVEVDSAALTELEEAVRAVPGLGDALDAARAANESDTPLLAEVLADGLKTVYDDGGAFSVLLDALWPDVLFGPRATGVRNVQTGTVHGNLVQLGTVAGSIDLSGPPNSARSRLPFFGSDRRAKRVGRYSRSANWAANTGSTESQPDPRGSSSSRRLLPIPFHSERKSPVGPAVRA